MRRLGTRAMTRWRVLAMVTIAAVSVATLGACVPGGETARSETRQLRLYTGAIPEPAPLVANSSGALEMPEPPTDFSDEQAWEAYQAAMQKYLEAVQNSSGDAMTFAQQVSELAQATRNSDEASVAAWQSLLVASGIAVGYGPEAVSVNGMEGAGIPMTMAELRLHALLGASPTRLPLSQVAQIIGGLGIFEETDLEQALYDDLSTLLATDFGAVFMALDPEVFSTLRYGRPLAVPVDEVTFTAAQVALILRKLSIDLLVLAENNGAIPAGADATAGIVTTAGWQVQAAAEGPCGTGEETPWQVEGRRNISKGLGWGFGEVVDDIVGMAPGLEGAKMTYQAAQALLALASLLAKMFAMQSEFWMGDAPLVRTKDRTAGERREIAVALSYPKETLEDTRQCLSALLSPLGIDLSDHMGGAASGVDVNLIQKNKRLQISAERGGTDTYHQQTGENGIATFPVLGKPQDERLPEGAEPEEVTARVQADANVEGSDLMKDLVSAGWEALGKSIPSMFAAVAARMKLVSFVWDVPVRDWTLVADFDMTLSGTLRSHTGINRGGVAAAPCGVWTTHESTTGDGTVESSLPVRVTAHYITEQIEGEVISGLVFFPKGSSLDALTIGPDGGEIAYPQVNYRTTKSESSPGNDPMPPHYEEPFVSGCGDGDGSSAPPQPDCGARDYLGLATILVNDGAVRVLADEPNSEPWRHCGSRFPFADPLAPPSAMSSCASPQETGGAVPSADSVFNKNNRFEISGSLSCARDGEGSLHRFTFEWTLTFCRVVEGKSDC
jgi:hypothetical protein